VLVSGYSGMGKSSLVQELHKVIVLPRGIFISGKFDRTKRNVPYALLAQVFQTLVHQILSESQQEVAHWRATILEALGSNGQLMINLIPELELVIGKQPVVPELPPQETQNRFEAVLRGFIGVFARKEHPLVLFVDDLQWLDPATLKLLEQVATDSSVQHLLLIGAYRDNEVTNLAEEHLLEFDLRALLWGWDMERIRAKGFTDNVVVTSVHPLMLMLGAIRKTEAIVHEISLNPLSLEDVNQLLGDANLPIAKYPEASATNPLSAAEETAMNHCIEATEAINSLRSLLGWHPGQRINAVIKATGATDAKELESWRRYAMTLAKVETLNFDAAELNRAVFTHLTWADIGVEAPEGYDFEVARQKLQKQLDEVGKHAAQHEARLNDSRFMTKADPETKVEVAQRFEGLQAQQKLLTAQLEQLGENA